MIKCQQSQALTSHFENFWSIVLNFFSGAMIVPSSKYNISDEVINDYQFVSTLLIKSLNKNDFAQYVCVAKNTIGKSEETIKIYGKTFK